MQIALSQAEINMILQGKGQATLFTQNTTITDQEGRTVLLAVMVEGIDASHVFGMMHEDIKTLWNKSKS